MADERSKIDITKANGMRYLLGLSIYKTIQRTNRKSENIMIHKDSKITLTVGKYIRL